MQFWIEIYLWKRFKQKKWSTLKCISFSSNYYNDQKRLNGAKNNRIYSSKTKKQIQKSLSFYFLDFIPQVGAVLLLSFSCLFFFASKPSPIITHHKYTNYFNDENFTDFSCRALHPCQTSSGKLFLFSLGQEVAK